MLTKKFLLVVLGFYGSSCQDLPTMESSNQMEDYSIPQLYPQYDIDRIDTAFLDLAVNFPVVLMAFLSAVVGGIMAPLITEGFRTIRNIEIPEIELPKIKRKDERYNYDDVRSLDDSQLFPAGLKSLLPKVANNQEESLKSSL